jgi:hypothetical protein
MQQRIAFARGSWVARERQSWTMWYPWWPFRQQYSNEPGIRLHVSPEDAAAFVATLESGAARAPKAVGDVLRQLAAVAPSISRWMSANGDGSIDLRVSEHGLQVGKAPAADLSAWLGPVWAPVAGALRALPA